MKSATTAPESIVSAAMASMAAENPTFANTSRHLQILRRARLVTTERQGKNVLYSLSGESEVVRLLKALGCTAERNMAEVRQIMSDYFSARDELAPVSPEALAALLEAEMVMLLDVRPEH